MMMKYPDHSVLPIKKRWKLFVHDYLWSTSTGHDEQTSFVTGNASEVDVTTTTTTSNIYTTTSWSRHDQVNSKKPRTLRRPCMAFFYPAFFVNKVLQNLQLRTTKAEQKEEDSATTMC
ncbi:hypothetical protein TorRG33x02_065460 [Trema orientale]|uniref:Uncharacterized protein n=1 Tax=Trema orientale TaxID=63057 RepID=A0A2P5FIN9_TREOI|nr:hypothetical protein TorRG33x02_065460 [Trema orientale]